MIEKLGSIISALVTLAIVWMVANWLFGEEAHETEDYRLGYMIGEADGIAFICRRFEENLPEEAYEEYAPLEC